MAAAAPLTTRDLNRATLARQGLLEPIRATNVSSAVERIGSLQAQHPDWPPIALASRAADARTADLAGALERREVVRSSLMRNTIHVVTARDLWPMFVVCQPLRLNQWRLMMKADPVESELGRRLLATHEAALAALRERPRSSLELDRLMSEVAGLDGPVATRPAWREPDARVTVRAAWRHFSAFVPLVHVPHDGEGYGRSRYAIAAEWVDGGDRVVDEREARVLLARRYLAAFGPASVDDLAAYVGRGKGGIGVWREALDAIGAETVQLQGDDGRALLDLAGAARPPGDIPAPPRLLARWDSVLLSHGARHRRRVIDDRHRDAVFTKNADVRPTILVDGFVGGTWDMERGGGRTILTLRPFERRAAADVDALVAEAERVLSLLPGVDERDVRVAA